MLARYVTVSAFHLFHFLAYSYSVEIKDCSNGYTDLLGEKSKYCYMQVKFYQSFPTARAYCEKGGGDLATFHNENEENFFRTDRYNHYRFGYRIMQIRNERHWVALDRIRSDNRTKKIDWTSSSGKAGDCMKLLDGKFIRKRCHKRYFSVCQKPKLDHQGYVRKLFRTCKDGYHIEHYDDVRKAKRACNLDTKCAYIASKCHQTKGSFKFCSKGEILSFENDDCLLQKDCYKYDVSIAGTPSTTTEVLSYKTPEQCQRLCQRTKGCAWFELDKMGTCHLKNEATKFISNPKTNGIISGPQICGDSKADNESSTDNYDDQDGNESNTNLYIVIAFIITIFIVVVLILGLFYERKKRISTDKKYTQSLLINGPERSMIDDNERFDPSNDVKSQANLLPYDTKREIPRTMFEIKKQIGIGNFGTVSRGELTGLYSSNSKTTVAIKSTKGPAEGAELRDFLHEIKIMSYTKAHLNLVSMIGSCSSDIEHEKEMWLIIEFCNLGDLKTFLVENKKSIMNGTLNNDMNGRCLIQWAYDIGKGMEFLFKQKIMHGDLAARNVMLDENPIRSGRHVAKIADFGLSKRFYSDLEYEKQSRVFVPWKWMAYEYLTCDYFTLTSDVWSFGIVLWEIFSLGKTPYGHQEFNDVVSQLEDGYRLPCPSEVKDITDWDPVEVYENVTSLCFKEDPTERGTFGNVIDAIESHLSAEELSFYAKMEEKYKTERSDYYFHFRNRKI